MKKPLFIITLLFTLSIAAQAQWTPSGSNAYFNLSGNVGIGTSSPAAKLDVYGGIAVNGTTINSSNSIATASDGTYVIASGGRIKGTYTLSFEAANRVQTVVMVVNATQYDGASTLSVLTDNSYAGVTVMSNFRLRHSSDMATVFLTFDIGNRNSGTSVLAYFSGTGYVAPNWGGTLPAGTIATGRYPLVVNNSYVGIGTTNPLSPLNVQVGNALPAASGNMNSGVIFSLDPYSPAINMGANNTGSNYTWINSAYANNSGVAAPLIINQNGASVGIGTTNPGSFKLAVNGTIRAKEIIVETGWSDYVFYKNYRLPSLKEVSTYIKSNGHLPDVPSAKEVADNGISLGENNSVLLKKIEELTLYLIEKDQQLANEQKEIAQLKKGLKTLTSKIK